MMKEFNLYVDVEDERWAAQLPHVQQLAEDAKDKTVARAAAETGFLNRTKVFNVNLCLSNDETVKRLNLEFRNMDKATNVLSFANIDDELFEKTLNDESIIELGDVIVAYETMDREAKEQGVTLSDHFTHLWVHGLLHILGYDHIEAMDAVKMEQLECEILASLGVANPYQE